MSSFYNEAIYDLIHAVALQHMNMADMMAVQFRKEGKDKWAENWERSMRDCRVVIEFALSHHKDTKTADWHRQRYLSKIGHYREVRGQFREVEK